MREFPRHPWASKIPKPCRLSDALDTIDTVGTPNTSSLTGTTTTTGPIPNGYIVELGGNRIFNSTVEASVERGAKKIIVRVPLKVSAEIIKHLDTKIIKTSAKIKVEYGR
jgi:hypothetical protein